MIKKLHFFLEYLKNPKTVGAVVASSKFLIKSIVKEINFREVSCIVELGAGQGQITKALLKKMRHNQKLLAFEINKKFVKDLKKIKDKRLIVIEDSAENLEKHVQKNGFKKVDCVIGALPLTIWPKKTVDNLLKIVSRILKPYGKYAQYASYLRHYQIFVKYFKSENIKLKYILLNIPPTFVYVCVKKNRNSKHL